MVKPSDSKDISPLEKWRRQKDKILEADAVESDDLTVGATSGSRKSSTFAQGSATKRGGSGDLKFIPIQAPPPKGEATMIAGQRRQKSADPTMMPIQAPPPKGEATMIAGQRRRKSAEPKLMPTQAPPPKGEATMIAGQHRRKSAEPKLMPTQAPPPKGKATMIPGQHRRKSGGPTMIPGQRRHQSADPLVNTFIDELKSIAAAQGMDFSIIQPDGMKFDIFSDSKALRVTFTGRGQASDRIVVREIATPAKGGAKAGAKALSMPGPGSARQQMLKWESGNSDAGRKNAKIDVATIGDANSGVFDWNEAHALAEIKPTTPARQIVMEAHYLDTVDGRKWLIELVNTTAAPGGATPAPAAARELTPDGAKRLVMVLLNCLRWITKN